MNVLVGLGPTGVIVGGITVGAVVLVASGVFVGSDVIGGFVGNNAPGVRNTLIHAG